MTVTVSGHVCVLADGVKETSTTVGTGTYELDGAEAGFVSFATGIGNGNKTLYRAQSGTSWEIAVGTVATGAPPTLARTLILRSSNSNNPISWTGTTIDIFVTAPAALLDLISTNAIVSTKVTQFTSNGSFSKDAKSVEVEVHCVGGGGGGGGAQISGASAAAEGAGGGAGAYAYIRLAAASIAASVTVTIGQGGAGGAGAANGSNGTDTSFGSHCIADNGVGGDLGSASAANGNVAVAGAAGGLQANSTGTVIIPGGFGGGGRVIAATGGSVWVGTNFGGAAPGPWGGGGGGGGGTGNGRNGRVYGGGGQGAHSQASAAATGGDGAAGICVVIERLKQ